MLRLTKRCRQQILRFRLSHLAMEYPNETTLTTDRKPAPVFEGTGVAPVSRPICTTRKSLRQHQHGPFLRDVHINFRSCRTGTRQGNVPCVFEAGIDTVVGITGNRLTINSAEKPNPAYPRTKAATNTTVCRRSVLGTRSLCSRGGLAKKPNLRPDRTPHLPEMLSDQNMRRLQSPIHLGPQGLQTPFPESQFLPGNKPTSEIRCRS